MKRIRNRQYGTGKALFDTFEKHGYHNTRQIARAVIEKGLIQSYNLNSLSNFYYQIFRGLRSIPEIHEKAFIELCEKDPDLEIAIKKLKEVTIKKNRHTSFYLVKTFESLCGDLQDYLLDLKDEERFCLLDKFGNFVYGEKNRKSLEGRVLE